MKISSAPARSAIGIACCSMSIPASAHHSMTSARVIPARHPLVSGGVVIRPSTTTKTLDPVPSQTSPARLPRSASPAPRDFAWASARTFSA